MPSLENLHRHFKDRPFMVVAIAQQEKKPTVINSVRDNGLTYLNLLDEKGDTAASYGVSGLPVKFLLDKQGNMVAAAIGYKKWDSDEVKALIEKLIE